MPAWSSRMCGGASAAWRSRRTRSGRSRSFALAFARRSSTFAAKRIRWMAITITTSTRTRSRLARTRERHRTDKRRDRTDMTSPPRTNMRQPSHRTLPEIFCLIDSSSLSGSAKDRTKKLFTGLGEAEAAIHGTSTRSCPPSRGWRARFDHRHRRHGVRARATGRRYDCLLAAQCRWRNDSRGARSLSGPGAGDDAAVEGSAGVFGSAAGGAGHPDGGAAHRGLCGRIRPDSGDACRSDWIRRRHA